MLNLWSELNMVVFRFCWFWLMTIKGFLYLKFRENLEISFMKIEISKKNIFINSNSAEY